LQLTEERLRIKDMEIQMKNFNHQQNSCEENLPLKVKHKASIEGLMEQKKSFMEHLNQVEESAFPLEKFLWKLINIIKESIPPFLLPLPLTIELSL
jgi:hypothetical protein